MERQHLAGNERASIQIIYVASATFASKMLAFHI